MSSRKLRLKSTRQKILFASGIAAIVAAVSFCGYQISKNINGVNAAESKGFNRPNGSLKIDIPEIDAHIERGIKAPTTKKISGTSPLPTSYDSRALGFVSRQEDQAGEGLCWAYSFTTTAETYLKKSGLVSSTIELSPKQLDYATAPAAEAFSDSTTNKYNDFIYQNMGLQRDLSDGGNSVIATLASSGKYTLTEDDAFFSKMKLNDPDTLGSFNSYGDFIVNNYELALEDYLAHDSTRIPLAYTTKQKTADVFDSVANRYAVTGYKYINLEYYSQGNVSEDQQTLINEIKNSIVDYGAVVISTYFDENNCMYVDGQNYTIIDRTSNDSVSICDVQTGHDMTLVGWDDNWAYQDNGAAKTGAFIIQNSYGNDNNNYYFAYSSNGQVGVINEMQKTNSYDNAYDLSDFNRTIKTGTYEVEFDFPTDGSRKLLDSLAISTRPITGSTDLGWDVYVKSGDGSYAKVGRLPDEYNGEVYSLRSIDGLNVSLNGDFSVKIIYDTLDYSISGFDTSAFAENVAPFVTVTAYTNDIEPDTPGPDSPDDPTPGPDTPAPSSDSGEEIPVPNTSSNTSVETGSTPNTGQNAEDSKNSFVAVTYILPIIAAISAIGYIAHKNKKHVRFDHK